jgi:hypothetical protein
MIIPGQSLTSEPKNAPYENPPELTTPEDAIEWHLDRLTQDDKVSSLLEAMELGMDVVTLTEGLLRGAVVDGRHSIDISLIIAPVVHEFIKSTADKAGVDYDEGIPDDTAERVKVKYEINVRKAKKYLAEYEGEDDTDVPEMDDVSEEVSMDETIEETEAAPAGLMSRMSKLEGGM